LVVGTWDGEVALVDLDVLLQGRPLSNAVEATFAGEPNIANPIAVAADGKRVATAGWRGPARVFADDGTNLATIPITADAGGITFDLTGTTILVADDDVLSAYSLDPADLVELATQHVRRELTSEECRRYLDRDCP
jgi:hypothetical protein